MDYLSVQHARSVFLGWLEGTEEYAGAAEHLPGGLNEYAYIVYELAESPRDIIVLVDLVAAAGIWFHEKRKAA